MAINPEYTPPIRRMASFFMLFELQDDLVIDVATCPWPKVEPKVAEALDAAYENVRRFHFAQKKPLLRLETMPGVECRRMAVAIEAVGLYVPGGTAVLPSTAYMLATPAKLAGCKEASRVLIDEERKALGTDRVGHAASSRW